MQTSNSMPHAAPVVFGWADVTGRGVARLVKRDRVVVACDSAPPLLSWASVRFTADDGGMILCGIVRHVYGLRHAGGLFVGFELQITEAKDDPSDMALLGPERAQVVAH